MKTRMVGRGADVELLSRLAAIVESSADAIVSSTLDGVITSWNGGATAMYGYAAEEMIGQHVSVLFPPDRAGEFLPVHDQIRRGGQVGHYETRRVRRDGTIVDVSVSVFPVRDEGGVIVGVGTVARDVTERLWAEAERREAEARLRRSERMETVTRLAGGIAHEFGGLLSAVIGYAGWVADAVVGNPQMRADVHQIQVAAGRAARLAWELLIFSGREPARPGRVDLNAVLAGARDLLHATIGADVELRLRTAPGLPTVMADHGQMEQVLVNLAINARDAMPEGGILMVATGRAEQGEAEEEAWPGARPWPCVELTVSDTGCGMDAVTKEHAFEPFFTTKPPGHGAGLGLSAVYGIITKAGGGVTIDSQPGMGTTVRMYLPAICVPGPRPSDAVPAATQGHGETILVVDDEPAALEITARILGHNGYHVLRASTREEALSLISAHRVQLLLADTLTPAALGPELLEQALDVMPGMRVLCICGSAREAMDPDRPASADKPFIRKPFTAQELLEKVRTVLAASLVK